MKSPLSLLAHGQGLFFARVTLSEHKWVTSRERRGQYAGYVMVFTTVPASHFSTTEVLEWYRVRWQIELVFKRLKTLAELGSLPKHDDQSARAWLYGKLLIALLGQKLERLGRDISPWGYRQPEAWQWQRVAGL